MAVLWVVFLASLVLAVGSLFTCIGRASDSPEKQSPSDRWQDLGSLFGFAGAIFAAIGSAGALWIDVGWPDFVLVFAVPTGLSALFTYVMWVIVRRTSEA